MNVIFNNPHKEDEFDEVDLILAREQAVVDYHIAYTFNEYKIYHKFWGYWFIDNFSTTTAHLIFFKL